VRLHHTDVLEAAMVLLETEGLEKLTMRRLATSLNVQPGALYWHFADKKALLDAMAERLLVDAGKVDPALPWDERVDILAHQVRSALRSHRDGARLLAGTFVAQPNTLRTGQAFLIAVRDAGFTDAEAGATAFALLYYILGHTIEEQAREELIAAGRWQPRRDAVDAVNSAAFPDFSHVVRAMDNSSGDARFAHGLQLFIDGIRHQQASRAQERPLRDAIVRGRSLRSTASSSPQPPEPAEH
jgi:TetR/AcrR family tetracycline transcriptional repressor